MLTKNLCSYDPCLIQISFIKQTNGFRIILRFRDFSGKMLYPLNDYLIYRVAQIKIFPTGIKKRSELLYTSNYFITNKIQHETETALRMPNNDINSNITAACKGSFCFPVGYRQDDPPTQSPGLQLSPERDDTYSLRLDWSHFPPLLSYRTDFLFLFQ